MGLLTPTVELQLSQQLVSVCIELSHLELLLDGVPGDVLMADAGYDLVGELFGL